MAKKKKNLISSVFIACEGTNTEPLYFEKFKEVMEDEDDYPYAITTYPDRDEKKPKTNAVGLVKVAIDRKDEFDELWVVFDKDGYTKHKEAFDLAKKNGVNIAFSSISFETWVLLHFERNNHPFPKSANIINEKFHNNECYISDYAKSGDYNVYPCLKNKTQQAIENAPWLRNSLDSYNQDFVLYDAIPFTDIDFLVKKLILNDYVYEFRLLSQKLVFNNVEITILNVDGKYSISIKNSTNRSLVTNEFKIYDAEKNIINFTNSNLIIQTGNSLNIELIEITASNKIFVEFENLKLEVSLKN